MSYMTCPKCQHQMQSFTRSGLTVEQCAGCRGVFLDYGELERIVQAEGAYYAQQYGQQPMPPAAPPMGGHQPSHQPSHQPGGISIQLGGQGSHGSHGYGHGHSKHKRRKSFLEELLD